MTATPYDALSKHTFSQPQYAIELFRSLLPPAVVQHIDFDTLRVEPASFIDDELPARFSDLLFGVHLAGQPAYLYLLLEHQSNPSGSCAGACCVTCSTPGTTISRITPRPDICRW